MENNYSVEFSGVDVSHHQETVDWGKVKSSGKVTFAIVRMGYGDNIESQDDKQFINNINGIIENNIPFAVYLYSYAKTLSGGESSVEGEIAHAKRLLEEIDKKGKKPFAVYYSLSEPAVKNLGKDVLTSFAKTFCSAIKEQGYCPGVYMDEYGFNNNIDVNALVSEKYSLWVAKFGDAAPNIGAKYDIWNYNPNGEIEGFPKANVCLDKIYKYLG